MEDLTYFSGDEIPDVSDGYQDHLTFYSVSGSPYRQTNTSTGATGRPCYGDLCTDGNVTVLPGRTDNGSSNFTGHGDYTLPKDSQIGFIVIYSFTIILSIAGNAFVVLVFVRGRRSRTDLRPFLINLAIADLIMAVFCMPFSFTPVLLKTWIFSKPMCPLVLFMQFLSVAGSVFTNMAIGIDRFLAVILPLRSRVTKDRAKYVILTIWLCSFSLSCVQLFVGRAVQYGDIIDCNEHWPTPESRRIYSFFVFFITYVIPLFILMITYTIVGILLWKRTAPGNAHQSRDRHQLRSKRKVRFLLFT